MKRLAALMTAFALATSCAPPPLAPAREYTFTTTRDEYGVPHVHGATDADAAYGLAYAHAEDNFETIQITVLLGRGKLGAYLGEEGARSDFLWNLLGIERSVEERYESDISPEFRAMIAARWFSFPGREGILGLRSCRHLPGRCRAAAGSGSIEESAAPPGPGSVLPPRTADTP